MFNLIYYLTVSADPYAENYIFESTSLKGKKLFDYMCEYSKKILLEKYGSKLLDFKNDINKRIFAFTIKLDKEYPNQIYDDNQKNDQFYNIFNKIKTVSCRASIVINNNDKNEPNCCVMLELRNSTFRQIFDEFHWRVL